MIEVVGVVVGERWIGRAKRPGTNWWSAVRTRIRTHDDRVVNQWAKKTRLATTAKR